MHHRLRAVLGRSRRPSAALGLAVVTTALGARGEPVSLELPKAPAGDRSLLVGGADARGSATWRARVALDYATEPLVVLDAGQHAYRVVEQQLWVEPGLSLALGHRVLAFLEWPLLAAESGEPVADPGVTPGPVELGAGLGDPRLGARVRVLGDAASAGKLALGAEAWLPLGSADFATDDAVRLRPFVAASFERKRARVGVELGYLVRRASTIASVLPLRTGPALTLAVGGALGLDRDGTVEVGPELALALGTASGTRPFDPRSTTGQALLAARWAPKALPLVLTAGVGPGLGQGAGAASLRALAAVCWSPEEPPPPPDSDGDAVADSVDACPRTRGVASGDPMMHGCPELPTDTDGDAIPDVRDACPKRPGPAHADRRLHGCPPPPKAPEDAPKPRAQLVASAIVISEQVQFETGTAVIRPESDALLAEVARELVTHPELKLVEVQGHTDDTGTAELNRSLSAERARAVTAWLVAHGIAPERLVAKGFGPDRPLADNATEAGRAKNRRVEFRVLDPKPEAP